MAAPRVVQSKCPTCGANLPVPPGVFQVTCRYCQHVITVEHRKAPPDLRPFGAPGGMPSQTLYVDPDARKGGGRLGCIMVALALIPFLIPLVIGVGPWAMRSCKGAVKPFPIACSGNEEIEVSGNWEGVGPIATVSGYGCKIHIRNSKLKGTTFVKTTASGLEVTLENVTIETTDAMFQTSSNPKYKLKGTTLIAGGAVFDLDSNLELLQFENSTIESRGATAINLAHNAKIRAENGKIRGKQTGISAQSGVDLVLKKGSEITSSDGVAIRTSSGLKIEADGGKIEGGESAIAASSGTTIDAKGLILAGGKEPAIVTTSGLKLDLEGGSITSQGSAAISCDGGDLTLDNVKIQGTDGLRVQNGIKLKASKKTRIVGSTGYGVVGTSNSHLTLNDATIEAATKAFKGTVNSDIKLAAGSRLAGKRGGIDCEHNLELEGSGFTIDGGAGAGIASTSNAQIVLHQGLLRGTPAIVLASKPTSYTLEGTKVEGEQKVPTRW